MAMTVKRRKDVATPRVFQHKIADIRGGVSVKASELSGDYLREGSVLSAPDSNGLAHVIKVGDVYAAVGSSDTTIKLKKNHHFKVGDFVLYAIGAKASTITAIDASNSAYDSLTIDQALGEIAVDAQVAQAAAKSTNNTSALVYAPLALSGTGKPVDPKDNLDVDAWLIGVTKGNTLPSYIASALSGIINF